MIFAHCFIDTDAPTRIMRPVLKPENVYAHPHHEQDVILWYNRALWHSIVSLKHTGMVGLALIV
jgi:alpha-ketoglutarate-dependent taurine dioxygenase